MVFSKKKRTLTKRNYIQQLFYLILIISATGCSNNAKIDIKPVHDFGIIQFSDTLNHSFFIKNISKEPLIILDVEGSCSCTALDFSSQPIKKGDSARIDVQYIPKEIGEVEKTIVFEANTSPPYTILKIRGTVIVEKE
ncbi:DUF1573 domain-containing protein [uncultured Dokdonia sp.]|uniref:DUF1573 domain-containing protein n=1 Tax=uncultured Dokdonia sp. TaxID=575653 RepID=UPI0026063EC6|nr:DUF1573 domain-containing protein [uncultured Dokdonia sp.]